MARKGCCDLWLKRLGCWLVAALATGLSFFFHFVYPPLTQYAIFIGIFVTLLYETVRCTKSISSGYMQIGNIISKAQLLFNVLYFRDYVKGVYFIGMMLILICTYIYLAKKFLEVKKPAQNTTEVISPVQKTVESKPLKTDQGYQ
jgi:hypothetical protein